MRTLGDIKEKREAFYNAIKGISFESTSKHKNILLKMIVVNCGTLYKAIDTRIKAHNNKSESDKYLEGIKTYASVISNIGEIDTENLNEKFEPQFLWSLEDLKSACEKAGNAKFGKLTFGAALDYKPTQKKLIELSKEIKNLVKKWNNLPSTEKK